MDCWRRNASRHDPSAPTRQPARVSYVPRPYFLESAFEEFNQLSGQLESLILKCCNLLNGPTLEYLSWIMISRILGLEAAHVPQELMHQLL